MSKFTWAAVVLFILILIAGYTWWFYENFEEVTVTERSEMSPEARRNPLLAAQYLLSRLGKQAQSRSGRQFLVRPPEQSGVLLVRDLGAPLTQNQVEALLGWVEAGGHLIATPGQFQDEAVSHPLLQSFGVEIRSDCGCKVTEQGTQGVTSGQEITQEQETTPEQEIAPDQETASILLPGDTQEESFAVEFDPDYGFDVDYAGEYWRTPAEGYPHLLIYPLGAGFVTFLSDSDFFDNTRIGDADHAPLLAELTAGYDQVWLLYSAQMPSLIVLLWRWAPYLLLSLGLLGLLLIWRMTRRSGPLSLTAQTQRRDLLEHLQAAAEFNWRVDPGAGLLQQVRKQVEKRWLTSHPHLQRLDAAARCDWLAERIGMSAEAIDLALYQQIRADGGQLVKTTANLQRLLAALHPQSKKR
jgi:hypothetical protein